MSVRPYRSDRDKRRFRSILAGGAVFACLYGPAPVRLLPKVIVLLMMWGVLLLWAFSIRADNLSF